MNATGRMLVVTDPTYIPREHDGLIDRIGLKLINDKRDLPFIKLMLVITALIIPFAIYLYLPGQFSWWIAPPYLIIVLGFFLGPYILMLHNTSHRPLFKVQYHWMQYYITWVLGPFFGETPNTYYVHHIGMHHPENNLEDDLSSTMRFQRDSIVDFGRYLGRFMTLGVLELLVYMWRRRRLKLMRRALIGEAVYLLTMAALFYVDWQATLVVFIAPLLFARFAMMAGNWAQHAFIDAAAPDNCYRNSITCINCGYNRRCFNDGYHIGHHLKANRHWTEMPVEFEANKEIYAKEGAIVFQGVDFFIVWAFLMLKRYNWLADRFVDLSGEMSREEIIGLLKERTRRITVAA